MGRLTHFDEQGQARMVDVSDKQETERVAIAQGEIQTSAETARLIAEGEIGKGDVLAVARLAGIMAAKRTADLIPLCHPLPLSSVSVELTLDEQACRVRIEATCKLKGRTGVEMEALTAVSTAALTVYDMVKGLERGVTIEAVRLLRKEGGRTGTWERPEVVD